MNDNVLVLNSTSIEIYQLMRCECSYSKLLDFFNKKYQDISPEQLENDIFNTVQTLIDNQVVETNE